MKCIDNGWAAILISLLGISKDDSRSFKHLNSEHTWDSVTNRGQNKASYWSRSYELGWTSFTIFRFFGQVLTHINKMLIKLVIDLSLISVGSIVTFNFRDPRGHIISIFYIIFTCSLLAVFSFEAKSANTEVFLARISCEALPIVKTRITDADVLMENVYF